MKKLLLTVGIVAVLAVFAHPSTAQAQHRSRASVSIGIGVGGPLLGARVIVPVYGTAPRVVPRMYGYPWYRRPSLRLGFYIGSPYPYPYYYRAPYRYAPPPPNAYPPPAYYPPQGDDNDEAYDPDEQAGPPPAPSSIRPEGSSVQPYDRQGPTGGVELRINQRNAQVYVDGDFVGMVDEFSGSARRLELAAGHHSIEVRENGFGTLSFDVNVVSNKTITYRGELRRQQ